MVLRLNVLFGIIPLLSKLPRDRFNPPFSPPTAIETVLVRFCPCLKNLVRILRWATYGTVRLLNRICVIPGWIFSPKDHSPEVGLGEVGLTPFSPCPYTYW